MLKFFKTQEDGKIDRLEAFEQGCWVDLVNPTDDELEDACALTGVPEEMLRAALDEEETARVERDEGALLCLLDTPTITDTDEGDTYETIPLALIHNETSIVTVSLRGNSVLGDFISNRTIVDTAKPVYFILNFMMGNAKRFLSNLRQLDKKSLRLQAELHRSMKNQELIQLLGIENSLVYFSTSLSANLNVYNKLERFPSISGNEDYKDLFDDVVIETRQAMEMCNIYRDILSGTMDAYASVISNNLNVVMKLLAVITLVISVPTLIASLWGMNVPVPFASLSWGFWLVIGISAVITAVVSYFIIRSTNSIRIKTPRQIRRGRGHHPRDDRRD
ncbi:MAG TPA: magnesium transporter CorA family protein [Firmicutes bacterium]|mgnify:CR=1 FL=1|nr:magnesium transporter CorA family protein [Bacillota bacterium]